MRSTAIWSFLSLVALATGGLISGCDSDAKLAKSALGESCDKTADCNDGLKCIDHECSKSSGSGNGNAGEGPGEGGSSGMVGPTGPILSGLNESCTKTADCEANLICFSQTCVAETGEGGGGNVPEIRLGQLGEVCDVSADCSEGLICTPGGYAYPAGVPIGFVGVCSAPYGTLAPTGKSCTAECVEAADCCELPVELHAAYVAGVVPYGAGVESCADLAVALDGINCANQIGAIGAKCFAQATYCECGTKTWACEAGQCVYGTKCTDDGAVVGGCPTYTRSGKAAGVTTCNTEGACALEPVDALCAKDVDCDGELMTDLGLLCEDGECTCYKDTGGCYRACDNSLDCAPGKSCDDATHVCVPNAVCATDSQCATRMGNARYKCVDDRCQLNCISDYDCNGGSLAAGINSLVCGADHICTPIGCSNNDDCSSGAGLTGVRMFCTTPEPAAAVTIVSSAITD